MCGCCAGPPLEEHLAQSSLWPEVAKLYGHGAELFCVAASPSGDVLASACKAQSSSTAAVWLWDTHTWAALGSVPAHNLTVTQLHFSPDGQWLLSASRDRTVALYQKAAGQPSAWHQDNKWTKVEDWQYCFFEQSLLFGATLVMFFGTWYCASWAPHT